jgi:RNA recognition motif-containing protein
MNLFVGNLSPETTQQHLQDLFSEFGVINSVKIIIDSATGLPKGFGFVEMEDKFHSYDAIDNLDATYFMGSIISVKEAKNNKTNNKGGGGNRPFKKPGGFNSNRSGGGFNSNRGSGSFNSSRSSGSSFNSNRSSGGGFNSNRSSGGFNSDRNTEDFNSTQGQ